MATTVKREDIERILNRFIKRKDNVPFLPAEKVEAVQRSIGKKYPNVVAYVKTSKAGFRKLYVDKVNTKRITNLYVIGIHEEGTTIPEGDS